MAQCPYALIASITATAALLAEGKTADEINLLGAVFNQLGDTLATIAALTPENSDIQDVEKCSCSDPPIL